MKEKKIAIAVSIILGVVFLVSLFMLLKLYGTKSDEKGSYAKIYQNGELVKTVSLQEDATFIIEGKQGEYNKIQVKDGAIGIVEASCPDFLCGKMGFLSTGPIPITCLPNELVIEIQDDLEEIDGMVY